MKTIFPQQQPLKDKGLHALKGAEALCCFFYKGVLKGGVRCLRQLPDQPRRLDPVTLCMMEGDKNGTEEKDQTRLSVCDIVHSPLHFRSSTLNSWALQRGAAETTGKRMGCTQGKPWNFLSGRPSGWSTETLALLFGSP